ncbi:carbohydrate ABC transporter permease [Tessaracoccus massiliensis]|uniref:carbohydrate ABC transporter permease n=1 Tax=Tessaracoccus massiliensis TaxID=1522311 RepID=UPI00058EC712|nr:carbohydrate ABC transporter permease [Tessaracoccus massiliensis]
MAERDARRRGHRARYPWAHVVLLLGGVLMTFPFLWQILMSLSTNAEIQSMPPKPIPDRLHFENYTAVFDRLPFLNQFGVSVLITVARTLGQVVLCSLAGYAFARMRFRFRNTLFILLLLILMIPSQAYIIPQYGIIQAWNLLETPWAIILPGLFSAFGTFLMRQQFMSLPSELEEAARLDGANPFQVFSRVMLPLATPGLFAVAITTVLYSWNDLLWPLIVTTREESMPLSVGIATLQGQHTTDYAVLMAASVMAMAPIFILFMLMQRRVIEGLATSGLQG